MNSSRPLRAVPPTLLRSIGAQPSSNAGRAQRLTRPGPEAEAADVVDDQPVPTLIVGVDVVDHLPPGLQ